jgi:mannose-6-phosphate isomerase-like protein (cupin superfamily)
MIINQANSEEYTWGNNCKGWHFVKNEKLGVIREMMPAGTEEVRHKHMKAQQFFFMLKGVASFELDEEIVSLKEGDGIHIPSGKIHKIKNETSSEIEFLVISEPHAHGDRETC